MSPWAMSLSKRKRDLIAETTVMNCLSLTELSNSRTIVCNVPDCQYSCGSVQDYESHYNSLHRYSCGECKKTLPNAHLLDLHLSETHDSYFAAQVQSGKRPMVRSYRYLISCFNVGKCFSSPASSKSVRTKVKLRTNVVTIASSSTNFLTTSASINGFPRSGSLPIGELRCRQSPPEPERRWNWNRLSHTRALGRKAVRKISTLAIPR